MRQKHHYIITTVICFIMILMLSCSLGKAITTPTSIITSTNTPTTSLGELFKAEKGGFEFNSIVGYKTRNASFSAVISNENEQVLISLNTVSSQNQTINNILITALDSFGLKQVNDSETYILNEIEGIRVEVKSDAFFDGATGEIIILIPDEKRYFTAIAIAGDSGIGWNPEGKALFNGVLDSIKFFEPSE